MRSTLLCILTIIIVLFVSTGIFGQNFNSQLEDRYSVSEEDDDDEGNEDDEDEETDDDEDDDEETDEDDYDDDLDPDEFDEIFDTDEVPFENELTDRDENIFGNKKEKASILSNMEYQIGFIAEGGGFDNADLRDLDETSSTTINNTDDRINLAYSGFFANFYFPLSRTLNFRVDLFKNGFWGHDQLAGRSSNNSQTDTETGADTFNFSQLFVEGVFYRSRIFSFSTRIGRQRYGIRGLPRDYIFDDYLDAVTLQLNHHKLGRLRILAADFLQMGSDAADMADDVSFISNDREKVDNFDGDVNVFRSGLVYEAPDIKISSKQRFEIKTYGFYARYGAVDGTGDNLSSGGTAGNDADSDYSVLGGARFIYHSNFTDIFLDTAGSTGIDRRLPDAAGNSRDINTDGFAAGFGAVITAADINVVKRMFRNFNFKLQLDGFYADGPEYDSNGNRTSHGFTSFKGKQIGGILLNRYRGVHPSAYTDDDGFDSDEHAYNRKSGTLLAHGGLYTTFYKKYGIRFDYWYLKDSGSSTHPAPGSASSSAVSAQQRLGREIGHEINLAFTYAPEQYWSLYAIGGIFLPGDFYATAGTNTSEPAGTDNFAGFLIGSKLVF